MYFFINKYFIKNIFIMSSIVATPEEIDFINGVAEKISKIYNITVKDIFDYAYFDKAVLTARGLISYDFKNVKISRENSVKQTILNDLHLNFDYKKKYFTYVNPTRID